MVGTFASVLRCEGTLHIPGIRAAYCVRPARARRGKSYRNVTHVAESFLGGDSPSGPVQGAIGRFVAARQLVEHPVAVSRWERE